MNVRLYNGTVRCDDCFDAGSYESLTTDPCTYCGIVERPAEPIATDEWIEAMSALIVSSPRREIQLAKVQCDWCSVPATWKIVDHCALNGHQNACTGHGEEWYPELFPNAKVTVS